MKWEELKTPEAVLAQPSQQGDAVAWAYVSVCGKIVTPYASEKRCRRDADMFGGSVRPLVFGDTHSRPIPVESLGRAADGVEGLDEDDDFGNPPGYTDWYNTQFFGQPVDTKRDHACEAVWRAAMTFARRLRPQVDEAMVERLARHMARENIKCSGVTEEVAAQVCDRRWAFYKDQALAALTAALTEAGHGK